MLGICSRFDTFDVPCFLVKASSNAVLEPQYFSIAADPPGWRGRNFVTLNTVPLKATRQSDAVLWVASSATVIPLLGGAGGSAGEIVTFEAGVAVTSGAVGVL